jgi:hypothetical protein
MSKFSLKKFVKKEQKCLPNGRAGNLLASVKEEASLAISSTLLATGMSITKQTANDFSSEVMEVSTSDEVLNELSEKVGTPLESETEGEFVQRASSALKNILMSKLGNK